MERLGHKNIEITLQTYTFNTEIMQLLLQENMKAYMSPDSQKIVENSRRKAQELE